VACAISLAHPSRRLNDRALLSRKRTVTGPLGERSARPPWTSKLYIDYLLSYLQRSDLNLRAQFSMSQPPRNQYAPGGVSYASSRYSTYARFQSNHTIQPQRPPHQYNYDAANRNVSPGSGASHCPRGWLCHDISRMNANISQGPRISL
jgi:hypothetical protein